MSDRFAYQHVDSPVVSRVPGGFRRALLRVAGWSLSLVSTAIVAGCGWLSGPDWDASRGRVVVTRPDDHKMRAEIAAENRREDLDVYAYKDDKKCYVEVPSEAIGLVHRPGFAGYEPAWTKDKGYRLGVLADGRYELEVASTKPEHDAERWVATDKLPFTVEHATKESAAYKLTFHPTGTPNDTTDQTLSCLG